MDEVTQNLYDAVTAYLQAKGWQALVVGGTYVQQQPGANQFNYEFVIRFTGGKTGENANPNEG